MNWKYKAFTQKFLDSIPFGRQVNYFMQRYLTKNLPVDEQTITHKFNFSFKQLMMLMNNSSIRIEEIKSMEFGAGWDLLSPLSYFILGIQNQTIVDLYKNLKPYLINDSVSRLNYNLENFKKKYSMPLRKLPEKKALKFSDLIKLFNIKYVAPVNMVKTPFNNNEFDFISSISTFEHIPANDTGNIFKECYRIIKPGGIMTSIIDLRDHYSYFDSNISIYNFLKFSERQWKLYNHKLQYQNRLRNLNYIDLINSSGFKIVNYEVIEASDSELKQLNSINLDNEYSGLPFKDLGIKEIFITLTK